MLPDGAIFCGECGRSVTVSANRRPVPAAPLDETLADSEIADMSRTRSRLSQLRQIGPD